MILWPKLAHEGLNGDGTEAYEIARSLESHPLPRWDLERWEGPGRFGTPAVNPFLTNAYLVRSEMAVLGRGELAARIPFVPAVVLAVVIAGGLAGAPGRWGWTYLAALGALYVLWNAYYVGYEPTFTDLAEPAATDTLMVALWLAGFAEIAAGAPWIGVGALWLSAFILYSAPVLALPALLAYGVSQRRWRPLALWLAALVAAVAAALVYGMLSGDLGDWVRQVKSEYWYDIVDQARRSATLPFAGRLLLLTGALPLLAVFRWRLVSPAARALACAALVYLILTFASSYKNLHYLAPLPFLLAPAALQASGPRARALAAAVIVAAFALSWPSSTAVHRETVEIGERSCVSGLGYEDASLQGDVVYRAFAPTGQAERFAVGKHTFVRYALERGGADCLVRLSPKAPEGWIPLAGDDVVMSTRDPAGYARWRLRSPPVPASWLFPQPGPAPLRAAPDAWPLTIALGARPGSALVIEDFDPRATATARARLLVPVTAQRPSVSVAVRVPHPAAPLEARINGAPPVTAAMTADAAEVDLGGAGWRRGWNVVELVSPGGPLALQAIRVSAGDR